MNIREKIIAAPQKRLSVAQVLSSLGRSGDSPVSWKTFFEELGFEYLVISNKSGPAHYLTLPKIDPPPCFYSVLKIDQENPIPTMWNPIFTSTEEAELSIAGECDLTKGFISTLRESDQITCTYSDNEEEPQVVYIITPHNTFEKPQR